MAERYLYCQCGYVSEIHLPGKAILHFSLHGEVQRVLLWVKGFLYQNKRLEQTDSFIGKLNVSDIIYFDCHKYDRESRDSCSWYAATASKSSSEVQGAVNETSMGQSNIRLTPRVVNINGYIFELDPGKGVILFEFHGVEQRVFFMRSKFYMFGKRPSNKHSLKELLSDNDPVQFDAEQCDPSKDNRDCSWFATLVWKGKKPTSTGPNVWIGAVDDVNTEDGVGSFPCGDEFPSLGLPPGLSDKQGYKAFEASNSLKEGRGNVLHLFNEECGIALWMVRRNTWETVFFHRRNSFLNNVPLGNFDLQESIASGTSLEIAAVPAIPEFPCRWIAKKATAMC